MSPQHALQFISGLLGFLIKICCSAPPRFTSRLVATPPRPVGQRAVGEGAQKVPMLGWWALVFSRNFTRHGHTEIAKRAPTPWPSPGAAPSPWPSPKGRGKSRAVGEIASAGVAKSSIDLGGELCDDEMRCRNGFAVPTSSVSAMTVVETAYEKLTEHVRETALWHSVESLLGWDERTMLPTAGGDYRAEQMTLVAGMLHKRRHRSAIGGVAEYARGGEARSAQRPGRTRCAS